MLLELMLRVEEEGPDANDVVAGWTGFAVFMGLVVAVALLCWSFIRQLRKADRARKEGVYGKPDEDEGGSSEESR